MPAQSIRVAEAARLRDKASAAAISSGLNLDLPDGAFFGFAELARAYVEDRRQETFGAMVRGAQPTVERFARLAQQRIQLSAVGLKAEYDAEF